MSKFCKRPVEVEAMQLSPDTADEIIEWTGRVADYYHATTGTLYIRTREGVMTASKGDWIIKGVAGEYYPCKPEIFAATYDAVGEAL